MAVPKVDAAERVALAAERVALAVEGLNERAVDVVTLLGRCAALLEEVTRPSVFLRASRAIPSASNVRHVASIYRRAAPHLGPAEREELLRAGRRAVEALAPTMDPKAFLRMCGVDQ